MSDPRLQLKAVREHIDQQRLDMKTACDHELAWYRGYLSASKTTIVIAESYDEFLVATTVKLSAAEAKLDQIESEEMVKIVDKALRGADTILGPSGNGNKYYGDLTEAVLKAIAEKLKEPTP